MASVVFSHSTRTITFTRNPSYPEQRSRTAAVMLTVRAADGSIRQFDKGDYARVELRWAPDMPMTEADHAQLTLLVQETLGGLTSWTYTDSDGTTHVARFAEVGPFQRWSTGYSGAVALHLTES